MLIREPPIDGFPSFPPTSVRFEPRPPTLRIGRNESGMWNDLAQQARVPGESVAWLGEGMPPTILREIDGGQESLSGHDVDDTYRHDALVQRRVRSIRRPSTRYNRLPAKHMNIGVRAHCLDGQWP